MKLIRWVEVHIGRSRRKSKKDKDSTETKHSNSVGSDGIQRRDDNTLGTPLHKIEPIGSDLPVTRSADNTPRRVKHPSSPLMSIGAPGTPLTAYLANKVQRHQQQQQQYMRTAFPEPSPIPSLRALSSLENGSPRQRSRIRTNPWLPSPRSSRDSDLGRQRTNSSVGSESLESVAGSGFSSQSSGSIWDEPWSAFRGGGRSPLVGRLPRVTLEGSPSHKIPNPKFAEDNRQTSVMINRPIPRSSWIDFRDLNTALVATDESSDEAYSEDFAEEEDHSDGQDDRRNMGQDTGSPQTDSACGSDRDNSSSCSTTPSSETAISGRSNIGETRESLHDKVRRLRMEQQLVHKRVLDAREEEIVRREEHLVLRKEIVQFRRLLLLQTLTDLREQLERRYDNPSIPASWVHSKFL